MVGIAYVYIDTIFAFDGHFFLKLTFTNLFDV